METRVERLPSGKLIVTTSYIDGQVLEIQRFGDEIAIHRNFNGDECSAESYFGPKGYISRRRYEQLREGYPDMPAAGRGPELESANQQAIKAEHVEWKKLFKCHQPDKRAAEKNDQECLMVIHEEGTMRYSEWSSYPKAQITGLEKKKGASLLKGIQKSGAVEIFMAGIEKHGQGRVISKSMVVELPLREVDPEVRERVFLAIDKAARIFGFDGPFDDNQTYVHLLFG